MRIHHPLLRYLICVLGLALLGCPDAGNGPERRVDEPDRVSVSGRVTDVHGAPIEGARVTISAARPTEVATEANEGHAVAVDVPVITDTDSEGLFVALVPVGSHTIAVHMAALQIHAGTFTCSADTPMDLGTIHTRYDPVSQERDDDGDGFSETDGDCDDGDAGLHPGAEEVCDDGRDNDCDGERDCDDNDCGDAPACGGTDEVPGEAGLLWIRPYDPDSPVATWTYAGGVAVRITFFQDFRVTEAAGRLRLTAAVKETADAEAALAEGQVDAAVAAGRNYTLVTPVAVSGWGACSPLDKDVIVFASPATTATPSIDINAVFSTNWNHFECVGRYGVGEMRIEPAEGAADSPVPGHWQGTAGFGALAYRLSADGTAIHSVTLDFQQFSCGEVASMEGPIAISNAAGWPVAADAFSLRVTLNRPREQEMVLEGRFADRGTTASGTYRAEFNATPCEGSWQATPRSD